MTGSKRSNTCRNYAASDASEGMRYKLTAPAVIPRGRCREHRLQIALVTHLLGRQQPLSGVDIEKLLLARTKYFGGKMNASMPIAISREPEKVS